MAEKAERIEPTRRSFLDVLLGLAAFSFLGSVGYPVVRYLKPLSAMGPGGPVKLTPEELAQLDKAHFVILRAGPERILVLRDGNDQLRALNAKCTHEGCTVQYVPAESDIWCACHNGRFDLEGRVISGPPPRPLSRYVAQRAADGSVTVTAERA